VWFTDEEYAGLAAESEAAAFAVGSAGRVLAHGTESGATAFADAFGAQLVQLPELDETGAGARPTAAPRARPAPAPARPVQPGAGGRARGTGSLGGRRAGAPRAGAARGRGAASRGRGARARAGRRRAGAPARDGACAARRGGATAPGASGGREPAKRSGSRCG